ncbi:hypothetical protein ACEPAI_7586 [Sanghuangporus weigelae]
MAQTYLSEKMIAALDSDAYDVPLDFPRDLMDKSRTTVADHLRGVCAFFGNPDRQVVEILDATSTILVSKRNEENISVAMDVTKASLELYISSNGTDLANAGKHLDRVWETLKKIKEIHGSRKSMQEVERFTSNEVEDEIPQLKVERDNLGRLIYEFSIEKLMACFERETARKIRTLIQEVVDRPSNRTDQSVPEWIYYVDSRYMGLIAAMDLVFRAIHKYKAAKSTIDQHRALDLLVSFITLAHSNAVDGKEGVAGTKPQSLYNICSFILEREFDVRMPDAFGRFWDEVFSLHIAYIHLLRLAFSPSSARFLDSQLKFTIIQSREEDKRILEYDLERDIDFRTLFMDDLEYDDTSKESTPNYTYSICLQRFARKGVPAHHYGKYAPHSECNLLAYLVNHHVDAYAYIGVSDLSCIGCWLYFRVYNKLAKKKSLPIYDIRGSHSKTTGKWVKPVLLDDDLEQTLERDLVAASYDEFLILRYKND